MFLGGEGIDLGVFLSDILNGWSVALAGTDEEKGAKTEEQRQGQLHNKIYNIWLLGSS